MLHSLYLAALVSLAGAQVSNPCPAAAQAAGGDVSRTYTVRHFDCRSLMRVFARPAQSGALALRAGTGSRAGHYRLALLGVVPGNVLTAVGPAASVDEFGAVLALVDVPVERGSGGDRWTVQLRRAHPVEVRAQALRMRTAGTVRVEGKTLRFEGDPQWIRRSIGLVFLSEMPLPAQSRAVPASTRGIVRYEFRHQNAAEWAAIVRAVLPAGVSLGLDPAGNAVIARGDPAALEGFVGDMSRIDVPVETVGRARRAVATLERADPETVRDAISRLPLGGMVEVDEKHVRLEGPALWIRSALAVVLQAETGRLGSLLEGYSEEELEVLPLSRNP